MLKVLFDDWIHISTVKIVVVEGECVLTEVLDINAVPTDDINCFRMKLEVQKNRID